MHKAVRVRDEVEVTGRVIVRARAVSRRGRGDRYDSLSLSDHDRQDISLVQQKAKLFPENPRLTASAHPPSFSHQSVSRTTSPSSTCSSAFALLCCHFVDARSNRPIRSTRADRSVIRTSNSSGPIHATSVTTSPSSSGLKGSESRSVKIEEERRSSVERSVGRER